MSALFLTTVISCSQAYGILNRIQNHVELPKHVKIELINVIRELIPTCPVKIKKDGK